MYLEVAVCSLASWTEVVFSFLFRVPSTDASEPHNNKQHFTATSIIFEDPTILDKHG